MFVAWIKVFMWMIQLSALFYGSDCTWKLRMGTKSQVGVLEKWSQHWVLVSPKAWWVLRASSESRGCWTPLSIPDFWRRWTALDPIHNFNRYQFSQNICYNLLSFCSCLGNSEQLDTCYVNCSWIFITILGNIEIPFPPTPLPSSSIKSSFG